jgi:hypothetical protein
VAEFYHNFGFSYGTKKQPETWDARNWYECICTQHAAYSVRRMNEYFPVDSGHPICGFTSGSMPMPGWESWDCSKRSCSRGHDTSSGIEPVPEVQRILCTNDRYANKSFSFQLSLFGDLTKPIFSTYSAFEIKSAIEFASAIGNVSVWFPNYVHDSLAAACNTTVNSSAGFLVRFDTEFGDLPMLDVVQNEQYVTVSQHQKGVNVSIFGIFSSVLSRK